MKIVLRKVGRFMVSLGGMSGLLLLFSSVAHAIPLSHVPANHCEPVRRR